MTQKRINKIFDTDLGQQCTVLYTTSDNRIFIRHSEAVQHTKGQLDPNSIPLDDKTIIEWFPD